jgi:hypothetical protein
MREDLDRLQTKAVWRRGNSRDDAAVGSFTVRNPHCPRASRRPDPAQAQPAHLRADQRRTCAQRRACERDTVDSSPASDRTRASECLTRSADSSCKASHLFLAFWNARPAAIQSPIAAGSLALHFRRLLATAGTTRKATRLDDVSLTRTSARIRPARYLRRGLPLSNRRELTATGPLRRVVRGETLAPAWLEVAGRSAPTRGPGASRPAFAASGLRSMDPTTCLRGHIVHAMRGRQQC